VVLCCSREVILGNLLQLCSGSGELCFSCVVSPIRYDVVVQWFRGDVLCLCNGSGEICCVCVMVLESYDLVVPGAVLQFCCDGSAEV
jgi:hypothetical protein